MSDLDREQRAARFTADYVLLVRAIRAAEATCAELDSSFPDLLREALEEVAGELGGAEMLVRTRPGSWEADHLHALVAEAGW